MKACEIDNQDWKKKKHLEDSQKDSRSTDSLLQKFQDFCVATSLAQTLQI